MLVVGLGNPGDRYAHTRHNVGADVVVELAKRASVKLKLRKEQALVAEASLDGVRSVYAFPQTFMNESGRSVQLLMRRYDIVGPADLVVVHDELDLPVGRLKLKVGGGTAGHNGLKSIRTHLGSADFVRVRVGIGKPPGRQSGADYVLRRPGRVEQAELDVAIAHAADAIEMIASAGIEAAMNQYNTNREVP